MILLYDNDKIFMNEIMKKIKLVIFFFFMLINFANAMALLGLSSTKIIFSQNNKNYSLEITNKGRRPVKLKFIIKSNSGKKINGVTVDTDSVILSPYKSHTINIKLDDISVIKKEQMRLFIKEVNSESSLFKQKGLGASLTVVLPIKTQS